MNKKYKVSCQVCNKLMSFLRQKKIRKTCSLKCLKILQSRLTSGKNNGNFDNHNSLSKEHKRKIKESCQNINQGKNNPMFGIPSPMTGKKHTEETKQLMKENSPDRFGKDNPNWKNGTSLEIYPTEFNKELKYKIFKRDNFTCQKCDVYPCNDLNCHHIDYNKQNCIPENLITLCFRCNINVNANRDYWFAYFTYKIKED